MENDGVWGDGTVLSVACLLYKRPITVFRCDKAECQHSKEIVENAKTSSGKPVYLGYVDCSLAVGAK